MTRCGGFCTASKAIRIAVGFLCYYEVDTQTVGFSSYVVVAAAAAFVGAAVEEYLVDAGAVDGFDGADGIDVVDVVVADAGFDSDFDLR